VLVAHQAYRKQLGQELNHSLIRAGHLALPAAFRASIGAATAAWPGFTWGATESLCIMLPQEQRGLIPHSTSLDATT